MIYQGWNFSWQLDKLHYNVSFINSQAFFFFFLFDQTFKHFALRFAASEVDCSTAYWCFFSSFLYFKIFPAFFRSCLFCIAWIRMQHLARLAYIPDCVVDSLTCGLWSLLTTELEYQDTTKKKKIKSPEHL